MKKIVRLLAVASCLAQPFHAYADDTFFTLERRSTSLRNSPTNISTITAEDIQNTGAKTVADVIDQLPSVDVTRNGTLGSFTTVRLRGVPSSNQIRVLVDGQPMSGISADQNFDISQIPVEIIERVEVVRGGASVLYGANTVGGVINIITKKSSGKTMGFETGVDVRSHQTKMGRVQADAQSGLADASVILTGYETGGFQDNSDGTATNGNLNLGLSSSQGSRVSLRIFHNQQESGTPQGTTAPFSEWNGKNERAAVNNNKRSDKERSEGRLGLDTPFGDLNQLSAAMYGSTSESKTIQSSDIFEPDFSRKDKVSGAQAGMSLRTGTGVGIDFERDAFDSTIVASQHITNVGSYIQQDLGNNVFRIVPALRYDHHSTFGSQYSPRVTSVVSPTEVFSISGNVARSFRAPDFFDLYGDFPSFGFIANRNLKPEKAWTYDLGFSLHPHADTEFKLTGFHTVIRDRIESVNTDLDATDETNLNVSNSELNGVEVEGRFKAGYFLHSMNYTFTRARSSSDVSSKFVALAFTPRHAVNYQLKCLLPENIALINTAQYVSDQFSSANYGGIHIPPYGLWHTRLEKGFKKGTMYAGINNVLDRRYADARDFNFAFPFNAVLVPMDDRTYYAGASVKFGSEAQ